MLYGFMFDYQHDVMTTRICSVLCSVTFTKVLELQNVRIFYFAYSYVFAMPTTHVNKHW